MLIYKYLPLNLRKYLEKQYYKLSPQSVNEIYFSLDLVCLWGAHLPQESRSISEILILS